MKTLYIIFQTHLFNDGINQGFPQGFPWWGKHVDRNHQKLHENCTNIVFWAK